MRLHPSSCPFPRQTFDELMTVMSDFGKSEREEAVISGSLTDRPVSRLEQRKERIHLALSNMQTELPRKDLENEPLYQRSAKAPKNVFSIGRKSSFDREDICTPRTTKQPWDGTVYNVVSVRNPNASSNANRLSASFAMDQCEQSIARLQRDLELSASGRKSRARTKSVLCENKEVDGPNDGLSYSGSGFRFPSVSMFPDTSVNEGKGRMQMYTRSSTGASESMKAKEALDHSEMTAILVRLSLAATFVDFVTAIHTQLVTVSGCERAQLHFINSSLNISKLDNDIFQRPYDLWSVNFPHPKIPNPHSQQAARQCITIRVNEKESALYVPIPIPESEAAGVKIFGVVDLYRSSERLWTHADEVKVKALLDLVSPMCVQRYQASRAEYQKRQSILMRDATKALLSEHRVEILCHKAAAFACRLANAQAARVLLVSEDGKTAAVFEPGAASQERSLGDDGKAAVIEGELSAVYATVVRTATALAVSDTRRDPRFSSHQRAAGFRGGKPRPVSGSTVERGIPQTAPVRPSTAPLPHTPPPPRLLAWTRV